VILDEAGGLRNDGYWFGGLLVWGFAGLLVCWFAGLLVCWFAGLLVCWSTRLVIPQFSSQPVNHLTTKPFA
jgi:hypothetical protein